MSILLSEGQRYVICCIISKNIGIGAGSIRVEKAKGDGYYRFTLTRLNGGETRGLSLIPFYLYCKDTNNPIGLRWLDERQYLMEHDSGHDYFWEMASYAYEKKIELLCKEKASLERDIEVLKIKQKGGNG